MRRNKTSLMIWTAAVLTQWFCMRESGIFQYELPFFTGLAAADSMGGNLTMILYSLTSLPFLLLLFSGNVSQMLRGRGSLMLIRSYGRWKLWLAMVGRLAARLGLLIACMLILFSIGKDEAWEIIGPGERAAGAVLYYIAVLDLVLIQYVLELCFKASNSCVFMTVFTAAALLLSGMLGKGSLWLNAVLFPNLGFSQRNGVLESGENMIPAEGSAILLMVIFMIAFYIGLKKVSRIDIM